MLAASCTGVVVCFHVCDFRFRHCLFSVCWVTAIGEQVLTVTRIRRPPPPASHPKAAEHPDLSWSLFAGSCLIAQAGVRWGRHRCQASSPEVDFHQIHQLSSSNATSGDDLQEKLPKEYQPPSYLRKRRTQAGSSQSSSRVSGGLNPSAGSGGSSACGSPCVGRCRALEW